MLNNNNNKLGFSLIELLVVISIIGILVTLTTFALNSARESARDSRRKADLEQIRSALELYRSDAGEYPDNLSDLTSPIEYITNIPADQTAGRQYSYVPENVSGSNLRYELCAALEGDTTDAGCTGSCGATCSYQVTNP